jgi:hypothetical protein
VVGDVRNAMVAMGTSGTKDVLAHLPDDDALQAKDEVFRPIFSVARKEGNCALLDDLSENVMIGSDRKQNLKMALYAIVESKPTSIDVDKIKTLASQINNSFYNRVMKAQRTAAPDVLTYIFLAACCYFYRSSYVRSKTSYRILRQITGNRRVNSTLSKSDVRNSILVSAS